MSENFCPLHTVVNVSIDNPPLLETFPMPRSTRLAPFQEGGPFTEEASLEDAFPEKAEKLELPGHIQQLSGGTDGFMDSSRNELSTVATVSLSESLHTRFTLTAPSYQTIQKSSFNISDQQDGEKAEDKDAGIHSLQDTADCFKCGICSLSVNSLIEFLKHKIVHLAASKSSGCELCGVAYAREQSLFEHYKRKHKVVMMPGSKRGRPPKVRRPDLDPDPSKGSHSAALPAKEVHVVITRSEEGDLAVPVDSSADLSGNPGLEVASGSMQDLNTLNAADGEGAGMLNSDLQASGAVGSSTLALAEGTERLLDNPDPASKADQLLSGVYASESSSQADTAPDFHFILVTKKIQGNSINYGKQGFRCLHCEFQTSWKNSLVKHMKENHADMISIHRSMAINSAVKATQTSDNQILMSLSEYDASVAKKTSLPKRVRGIESQDLAGTFTCQKCNKNFGRLRYLKKHMITHKPDNKFLCDECGKAFKTQYYLQVHRRSHRAKEYRCSQCNFSSAVNSVIHSHRQIHKEGCVLCDICGAAYADRSTLKKHKMVHDPSRPYACQFEGCTWRFKTEVTCHGHFKSHTTKPTFKCNVCEYSFRHKHHLQRHQAKMHDIPKTKAGSEDGCSVVASESENKENPEGEGVILPAITNTLNVYMSPEQLQNALASGNLVIATDVDGNTVNYEVADVAYQTLLQEAAVEEGEGHAILIPHQDCNPIIFQQAAEI